MENIYQQHNPININARDGIIVADPCYESTRLFIAHLNNVLGGKYNTFHSLSDEGEWGKRVKDLIILHESISFNNEFLTYFETNKEYIDEITVDSGTAGFFNKKYYLEHHYEDEIDEEWYDEYICKKLNDVDVFDNKCFISCSGFGDGMYGVYALYNEDGKIVGAQIEYIENECEYNDEN